REPAPQPRRPWRRAPTAGASPSTQRADKIAFGDEDNPVGCDMPQTIFLTSERFEGRDAVLEFGLQLLVGRRPVLDEESFLGDEDAQRPGRADNAHGERESIALAYDFAFDALKGHVMIASEL